jgi:hypothetical protein
MQEARRAIFSAHGPTMGQAKNIFLAQAKKFKKKKNCSGNKWWELATKIENKMAPAF